MKDEATKIDEAYEKLTQLEMVRGIPIPTYPIKEKCQPNTSATPNISPPNKP